MNAQLMRARLSLEQTTEISEELIKIPWKSLKHRDDVLLALAAEPAGNGPTMSSCRRKVQDCTAIVHYFTEQQWEFLLNASSVPSMKLKVALEHAQWGCAVPRR